ncbi:EcsC family protein [Dactylosporangium sp. NPDC005572]|uniref:EcsC family protein n=1 Tax=Dactylosporangium sp. NPDC005572 TaxID=3156889 RepID=UPI0033AED107
MPRKVDEVVTAEADRVEVTRTEEPAPAPAKKAPVKKAAKKAVKKAAAKAAPETEQLDLLGDTPVKRATRKAAAKNAPAKKSAAAAETPIREALIEAPPRQEPPEPPTVMEPAAVVEAAPEPEAVVDAPEPTAPAVVVEVPETAAIQPIAPEPVVVVGPASEPSAPVTDAVASEVAPASAAVVEPASEPTAPEPALVTEAAPAQAVASEAAPESAAVVESASESDAASETAPEPAAAEPVTEAAVEPVASEPVVVETAPEPASPEPAVVVEVAAEAGGSGSRPAGGVGGNPAYLPEVLALAAVRRLGEEARRKVGWYKATYPSATSDAVARAVTMEFVRRARRHGAAAGAVGAVGLVVEGAALSWLQARLVLHLAAVYGHDPVGSERAAELLVIQRVHGSVETAEAAIRAAQQAGPGVGTARLGAPLVRVVGQGIVRAAAARLAKRVVPGAGLVVGALSAARATELLAARAIRYYRR